jgi:hypothetical protein
MTPPSHPSPPTHGTLSRLGRLHTQSCHAKEGTVCDPAMGAPWVGISDPAQPRASISLSPFPRRPPWSGGLDVVDDVWREVTAVTGAADPRGGVMTAQPRAERVSPGLRWRCGPGAQTGCQRGLKR